jgi:Trm5-related predicted tRNA methylase
LCQVRSILSPNFRINNTYWSEYFRFKLIVTLVYGKQRELTGKSTDQVDKQVEQHLEQGQQHSNPHIVIAYKLLRIHLYLYQDKLVPQIQDLIQQVEESVDNSDYDMKLFTVHIHILKSMHALARGDYDQGIKLVENLKQVMEIETVCRVL